MYSFTAPRARGLRNLWLVAAIGANVGSLSHVSVAKQYIVMGRAHFQCVCVRSCVFACVCARAILLGSFASVDCVKTITFFYFVFVTHFALFSLFCINLIKRPWLCRYFNEGSGDFEVLLNIDLRRP